MNYRGYISLLGLFFLSHAFAIKVGTIEDPINFFSKDAIKRANEISKEIKIKHKKQVIIVFFF